MLQEYCQITESILKACAGAWPLVKFSLHLVLTINIKSLQVDNVILSTIKILLHMAFRSKRFYNGKKMECYDFIQKHLKQTISAIFAWTGCQDY
jgi:hypothetical protein